MGIFHSKSLCEFQNFLKLRGIIFSNTKKADLIELCDIATSLIIKVDPDGLVEDCSDIFKQKLTTDNSNNSVSPQLIGGSYDISPASSVSIFDIYNYLVSFDDLDYANFESINFCTRFY